MARLLIKTEGLETRALDLRLGTNHIGRNPDCDFHIDHSTVSSLHCEMVLSHEGVLLRDCDSTNGTFVDRQPVKEAWLKQGQTVHLGDVRLMVESTDISISIPKFQQPGVSDHKNFPPTGVNSPVVLPSGALVCPRHTSVLATYKCTQCKELMCSNCVHVLKRQGGQPLFLCPICSGKCERIAPDKPKKKSFLDMLRRTAKLPFGRFTKPPKGDE